VIDLFYRLFGGRKEITLEELKEALSNVERDRRKSRREIRRWEQKRKQTLERMKKARAEGNQLEIDYLWEDFKEHRRVGTELRREGRIYNIEGTALKRYVRALERLERRKDRDGARNLLERVQGSGLMERLSLERDTEVRYLEEMNAILDEFDGLEETEQADPEKAMFFAELDTIRKAEEEGDAEEAVEREEELLERFGQELEEN
jgi:hypothetical protein